MPMKIYDIDGTEERDHAKKTTGDHTSAASPTKDGGIEKPNNTDGGEFTLPTEFVLPEGFTTSENEIIDEEYFFFGGKREEADALPHSTEEDATGDDVTDSETEGNVTDGETKDLTSDKSDEDIPTEDTAEPTEKTEDITEPADTEVKEATDTVDDGGSDDEKTTAEDITPEKSAAVPYETTDETYEIDDVTYETSDGTYETDGDEKIDTEEAFDTEDGEDIPATFEDGEETDHPHQEDEEDSQPSAKKKKEGRRVDGIFDFIELFVFTLVIVLFVTSFIGRHSVVDGDSMLGTLHDGETLIISDLFYEPRVGDIVVVDDHSTILKKPIIKRVIAVGGDTVRVMKIGIMVNGELLDEPYVYTDGLPYTYNVYPSDAYRDNPTLSVEAGVYYEFVVPEGELFVLGDHRNDSTDSRAIGTVDVDAVLGRVLFRLLPFDVFGRVN